MQNSTIHYNNMGYEAIYCPESDTCRVTVRGYIRASDGAKIERGGPSHPDDAPLASFVLKTSCAKLASCPGPLAPSRVLDTFHDALLDRRDLLGAPEFRHKPTDDAERRLFAAAYDAAQKVRANATILGVDKLIFSLNPSLFALVDCFSRDRSGAFWLMSFCADPQPPRCTAVSLPLAAYVLEAGGYIPSNVAVRLGVWSALPTGPRFAEVANDRIAARDVVINHILSTPF